MIGTSALQQHEPVALPDRSFGRVARSVAGYSLLIALMFISPLFVFVPAALFACGIRNGKPAAGIALAGATLLGWVLNMVTAHAPGTTPADALMIYSYLAALVVAVGVPAMIVLPLVERAEPFGRVLITGVLVSIVGLTGTEAAMRSLYHFSPYREQVARAHQTAEQFIAIYQKGGVPADAVRVLTKWMNIGVSCLPAFFLIDVIVVFVLSLVMFGRLKAWREFVVRHESATERSPVATVYLFRNFSLPEWLLFAFIIGGLTPLASGMLQLVTANTLAVVTFLYLLQGLAIFRSLLFAVGAGPGGRMFGYLLLGILTITGIAPLLLSIAGLFDTFFDFRHFRRKDHSDESHPH
jgi:hypothetical protein